MTNEKTEKTHWLQNPNKNYLGHWDLPNGKDVILTIRSAAWEEVKNPIINTSEAKRVIRFVEEADWLKPFICNEINANSILKSTGEKFMEDCVGKKIRLGVGQTKVKKEEVDCLRVRTVPQNMLESGTISEEEAINFLGLLKQAGKSESDFCKSLKIDSIRSLPKVKLEGCLKTAHKLIAGANNANNS
jgi:hypothetical protein